MFYHHYWVHFFNYYSKLYIYIYIYIYYMWGWAENFSWCHICCWWLNQYEASTTTSIEVMCEWLNALCWKINLTWLHSMRISWSAYKIFSQPSCVCIYIYIYIYPPTHKNFSKIYAYHFQKYIKISEINLLFLIYCI